MGLCHRCFRSTCGIFGRDVQRWVGSLWGEWLSWRERPLLSSTGPCGSLRGCRVCYCAWHEGHTAPSVSCSDYSCSLNILRCLRCSALNMVSQWEGRVCENPDLRPEPMWLLDPTERAGPSWLVVINSVAGPLPPTGQQGPSPHTGCGYSPLLLLKERRHLSVGFILGAFGLCSWSPLWRHYMVS